MFAPFQTIDTRFGNASASSTTGSASSSSGLPSSLGSSSGGLGALEDQLVRMMLVLMLMTMDDQRLPVNNLIVNLCFPL